MIRPALGAIVLSGLVLLPLAACTTTPEAEPTAAATTTAPSPSPSSNEAENRAETEADPCDLLPADAAEALAGEPMTVSERADVGGVPACKMSGDTRGIQVAQVPATVWAESLPALVEQIRSAPGLGEENSAKLDEMKARIDAGQYDALDACEFFATMVEFNGGGPGQPLSVTYFPDGTAPQAIVAQSCVDGTYTTLMLAGADITVSEDIEVAIISTLDLLDVD